MIQLINQASAGATQQAVPPAALDALTEALVAEKKLIDELTSVMLRQRVAVGDDDLQAVDDSVFATHRLLLTLGEARKRRRSINRILGYDEELGVKQLADALGAHMTPQLQAARDSLQDAARRLSREIDINRRVLRTALASSESLVRVMRGGPAEPPAAYGSTPNGAYKNPAATSFIRTA